MEVNRRLMAEQLQRLQLAENEVWDLDFSQTSLAQVAALIGARNEAFWLVNRVPALIKDIELALAKIDHI